MVKYDSRTIAHSDLFGDGGLVNADAAALYRELREQCRGKGLRERYLRQRMGLQLQRLCRVTDLDTDVDAREKVSAKLEDLMGAYPDGDRKILRAVLGLHPEADSAILDRRVDWLARNGHCSKRTVQREFPRLLRMLAEDGVAAERAAAAADAVGYEVETLATKVMFVERRATITELRKLRAIRRLDEVRFRYGSRRALHGEGPDVEDGIDIVHGGRLLRYERQHADEGDAIAYLVQPVRPIEEGEVYDIEVEYPYPDERPMTHYVVQPITTFGSFSLDLRFDPSERPDCVWRVDGVGHKEVGIHPPDGQLVLAGAAGRFEVITFHWIRRGGSYGAAWTWLHQPIDVGEGQIVPHRRI